MATLGDLVPPLGLCKQIPVCKFNDSALVWIYWWKSPNFPAEIRSRIEVESDPEFDDLEEDQRIIIYPAPTLAEIMEKLYPGELKRHDEWIIQSNGVRKIGAKPATVALMLWLELENKNA